jgi:hypothetical protein
MHSTEPPKNTPEIADTFGALEVIGRFLTTTPGDEPVRFVLELARIWKDRGGFVAGKPRHSDRYLDDLLRSQDTPVKSLTPKLAGKTNLRPADAQILVRLFLSHWDYIGDPSGGSVARRSAELYRPILVADEIEQVVSYVLERMTQAGPETRVGAVAGPTSAVPGRAMVDIIATEFRKSKAMFTIGPGQSLLVTKPESALIGFRALINRLWAIDRDDERDRLLVWILDLGRQDFEDYEARKRFLNVEALISRFKALRLFKEREAEARWDWMQSRAVIVLHDTRRVQPAVPWLPAFDPNHVLFSAVPPRWLALPEFRALYGAEFERLDESVYEIFLRKSAEPASDATKSADETLYELHYFGLALFRAGQRDERQARGLELAAPGRSYVEALGTVFAAAAQMLGLHGASANLSIDGMEIDPTHASESLRHHGFRLLRLEEFAKL